jgi:nucleoside recognition membrane protein YjiH
MPPQQTNQNNTPQGTVVAPAVPSVIQPTTPVTNSVPAPIPYEYQAPRTGMVLSSSQQKIMNERHKGSLGLILTIIAVIALVIIGATIGAQYARHLLHVVHTYSS